VSAGPKQEDSRREDSVAPVPWRHRLSTQLLGLTAILFVGSLLAYGAFERTMRQALMNQALHGAVLFGETIASATRLAMLEDRREDAYDIMRNIGRQPGIDLVRVFRKDGTVTFSTLPGEEGRVLDRGEESCRPCHQGPAPLARLSADRASRVVELEGHRALHVITPIHNEDRCSTSSCHHHAGGEQVLGVQEVLVSLEEADDRQATMRWYGLGFAALAVTLLGGALIGFARRRVVRPVAAILEGMRRVARDQLDSEILEDDPGELGVLAASFNEMTRALRRVEGDLKVLNAGLEQKVEDRTADLRRAQAALVQTEKLSSLGQLSASIAHEINNPLTGILTFAKLVTRELETAVPDPIQRVSLTRNLALVEREARRCSAIVRNLLDFARERPLKLGPIDANAAVEESLQLVGHQLSIAGLRLDRRLQPLPPVMADLGELRQAVVNLALNAMEAMGEGGTLLIETRAADGGRTVEIAVQDTGPGIAPEHLGKIFDPFFTTKEKGTGLGLSVVYGIVTRHGGRIEVESAPGRGARFVISLPAVETGAGAGELVSE
jgi:two-component system NtrC family sensor kinase